MPALHKFGVNGFAPIVVIIVAVVLISVAGILLRDSLNINPQKTVGYGTDVKQKNSPSSLSKFFSQGNCEGQGPIQFKALPVGLKDIDYIRPMGAMSGSHVTPVDHIYIHGSSSRISPYDVFAGGDGYIVSVEVVAGDDDYRLILEHSCTFYTIYIHVTKISDDIQKVVGTLSPGQSKPARVPVSAGIKIGEKIVNPKRNATQVDFSVHNTDVKLTGFVVPEHYDAEPWKIHTIDPYEHFTKELQDQLVAKTVRTSPPIGGKIDYDIDGKIVGNWFEEGTNGYGSEADRNQYWMGHLTIAYNYIDPAKIEVSIGDWNGESSQFAVLGDFLNPKDVGVDSGLVKYELARSSYVKSDGSIWDQRSFAKNLKFEAANSLGTMVVQLLEPQKLKMEIFPGKIKEQVNNFTSNARMYTR